jgi:hypothetical protein
MHGIYDRKCGYEKCMKNLIEKVKGKCSFERPRHRWENNIKWIWANVMCSGGLNRID